MQRDFLLLKTPLLAERRRFKPLNSPLLRVQCATELLKMSSRGVLRHFLWLFLLLLLGRARFWCRFFLSHPVQRFFWWLKIATHRAQRSFKKRFEAPHRVQRKIWRHFEAPHDARL